MMLSLRGTDKKSCVVKNRVPSSVGVNRREDDSDGSVSGSSDLGTVPQS